MKTKDIETLISWKRYAEIGYILMGFGLGLIFMSLVGWYIVQKNQIISKSVLVDTIGYQKGYKVGFEKGVLLIANYDRKGEGKEPYKTYDEFDKDLKKQSEGLKEVQVMLKELDERIAKKKELKKQYPQPWIKKEK